MLPDSIPPDAGRGSLIAQGERQLQLIPLNEMPDDIFLEGEQGDKDGIHEFTGERLWARDQERYLQCVSMLAAEIPVRRIGRLLHLSPNTVDEVWNRERVAVEAVKKRLAVLFRDITHLAAEGLKYDLLNNPDLISAKDKAIIMGVAAEKGLLYDGDPTVIFGSADQVPKPEHEDFNRILAEACRPTGLGAGNPAQKSEAAPIDAEFTMVDQGGAERAPGADPERPAPAPAEGADGVKSDVQSDDKAKESQGNEGKPCA